MKKIISIVLAVMFVAAAFCTASFAAGPPLTKDEIKTLIKAGDFIAETYRLKEVGGYADELIDTVAELFPETVTDEYEGEVMEVKAQAYQIRAAVNHKWGFMADETLNDRFMADFDAACKVGEDNYLLNRHSHGGTPTSIETAKGVFEGYTTGEGGLYTLYYLKSYPAEAVGDVLTESENDQFWDIAENLGFPAKIKYKGFVFVVFEGDYYRQLRGTYVYQFMFTESGLIKYVYDGEAEGISKDEILDEILK